jgi:hypothetical protein
VAPVVASGRSSGSSFFPQPAKAVAIRITTRTMARTFFILFIDYSSKKLESGIFPQYGNVLFLFPFIL